MSVRRDPAVAGGPAGAATRDAVTGARAASPAGRRVAVPGFLAALAAHWLFALLLLLGALVRLAAQLAYRPALIYYDSLSYFRDAEKFVPPAVRPLGYPAFLKALPAGGELAVIPAAQHLIGLGLALLLYVLLVRRGVPRWGAALATAPVLLDAYQVHVEQMILSEALFEAQVAGAIALLLWHRRPPAWACALAGVLLAFAAVTRGSGSLLVVPALLAVLVLRARPVAVAALLAAFVVPVAAYATWFHSVNGYYATAGYGGRFLYARVAPFVDCSKFAVPKDERVLCPKQPLGHRLTIEEYMWGKSGAKRSPVFSVPGPARHRVQVAGDFAKRAIRAQPLTYAKVVLMGSLRGFEPVRTRHKGELPIRRWQFQRTYPLYRPQLTLELIRAHGDKRPETDRGLARSLASYSGWGVVPGPVLALAAILALLGGLGIGRARRSGLRTASLLFLAFGAVLLVTSVATNQFTWRYWIPELVLLPPAGALGLTALLRREPSEATAILTRSNS